MPCLKPIEVPKRGFVDLRVTVACGQCIGCRIDRTQDWATRITHEASLHDLNVFLTLTYDDDHLPPGGSLVKKDFQDFMKRLRFQHEGRIRYFACGEYGDQTERPHYHAIIFGADFADKRAHSKNDQGDQLYTSDLLDSLWGKGKCFIGSVSIESAHYVAKYCIKKVNGQLAAGHYGARSPEFALMSLKPGIGAGWFDRYSGDVYPSDFVVLKGRKRSPPRYYDNMLEDIDAKLLQVLKKDRLKAAQKHRADQTPSRLKARMEVTEARVNLKKGVL
ncbi:VP4 [Gokushovirus WZ-2015a]|nr:VP4 [Gokushovirus WZ-2015a]